MSRTPVCTTFFTGFLGNAKTAKNPNTMFFSAKLAVLANCFCFVAVSFSTDCHKIGTTS